ncbi:hypothetical protein SCHPADRAFT_946039 [Schizopora paradoxa]|uniref:DUF6533 domain-containing protein n=1 Tax=Schizopora paradoxa TaxID=27342 RepID=A0A0H2RNX8_9AGAM|nr:hypothetical protein SCHPADRAFT_946039 [Schizopora paradoxa]
MKAASVALVYEYLIKLDSEVRYLWQRRFTFAGVLLFLCRNLPFLTIIQLYVYVTTTRWKRPYFFIVTELHDWRKDKHLYVKCLGIAVKSLSLMHDSATDIVYIEFFLALLFFTRAYVVWGATQQVLSRLALVYAGGIVVMLTQYSCTLEVLASSVRSSSSWLDFVNVTNILDLALRIGRSRCLFNRPKKSLWIALVILILCESLAISVILAKYVLHARTMKYGFLGVALDGERFVNSFPKKPFLFLFLVAVASRQESPPPAPPRISDSPPPSQNLPQQQQKKRLAKHVSREGIAYLASDPYVAEFEAYRVFRMHLRYVSSQHLPSSFEAD